MKSLLDPENNPGLFSGPLRTYVGAYTGMALKFGRYCGKGGRYGFANKHGAAR